jgi:hypothetical protein
MRALLTVVGLCVASLLTVLSYTMLSLLFYAIPYRTIRAELPNGVYLNRVHPFSEQIVLRAPDGRIVVRDIAHVLFNDRYVAGEIYETPFSRERFVYRVGDDAAVRDSGGADDPFEAMLDASGLEDEWPWGPEDPNWLDFNRLLVRSGYRGPFPE